MFVRILAAILLIFFSPLFLFLLIGYFFLGTKKILFTQLRIGLNHNPFVLYKFKTLIDYNRGNLMEREFPYGRFLRQYSLDELPQLFNILKGEMTFVGPRPLPVEYLPYFSEEQKTRFLVKPGITGWAQVNGRRSIPWDKKLAMDIEYVQQKSFWMDIKIIAKTIWVVLFKSNKDSLEEISLIDFISNKVDRKSSKS